MGNYNEHYNQNYRYDLPEGQEPGNVVNSLFDSVMRNDKAALEEVLKILFSNTYFMVKSRLYKAGYQSEPDIDDVLQNVGIEIVKAAFRGFSPKVNEAGFYGYLIRTTENVISSFIRNKNKISINEVPDTEDLPVYDIYSNERKFDMRFQSGEEYMFIAEKEYVDDKVIGFFLKALRHTKKEPYQVISYCYSILLPILFNSSRQVEFLRKVNEISGRKSEKASSMYNEEKGILEGDISRKSETHLRWAMDAMCGMTVLFLNSEFLELYNMAPMNGKTFSWGQEYLSAMNREHKTGNTGRQENSETKLIRDIVITEEYDELAIKNWARRVASDLLKTMGELSMKDSEFKKRSVGYVEEEFAG